MTYHVIQQLQDYHNKTGGKCGMRVLYFKGLEVEKVKESLKQLHSEGIREKLIFWKE